MPEQRRDLPIGPSPETAPLPSIPPSASSSPSASELPDSRFIDRGTEPEDSEAAELLDSISRRIGNYQLVRELASGGMGVVYEAIQDQPRRSVALKLMRCGLGSHGAIARFHHESQLLARLRHPGIAQVYEAGTHQQGALAVPYFVMEYIPGASPITDYANSRQLDLRKRIALMVKVCDAVQHGHEKGIVHRDLKPGNIVIDANGEPKVIDFGVALASDSSEQSSQTLQTDASQLIGTLPYMSPEQYESDPRQLDARSDVYSLGVVAYELLCARLPHDVSRAKLPDAARMICHDPPPRPSKIKPELRGDLETILLKALHKDRNRRYASAAQLGQDLSRVLKGEPIAARADSLAYVLRTRLKLLLVRHRIAGSIAAMLLAVATALWIGMPLIFDLTPVNRFFEQILTSHFAPAAADSGATLQNVQIIAMSDRTDYPALARSQGLDGVSNSQIKSFRRLHGMLMRKLVAAHARVVVWDFAFPDPSEFDPEFVAGAQALQSAGTDVVVGIKSWQQNAQGAPALSPAIAAQVRWGGITAALSSSAPWRVYVVVEQPGVEPMPSLSLVSAMAFAHPNTDFSVHFLPGNRLGVRLQRAGVGKRAPGGDLEAVQLSGLSLAGPQDLPRGIASGSVIASNVIDVPSDSILVSHTIDYASIFTASPEQLRGFFESKVVVIGDARPAGRDGPFAAPDGRMLQGFVAQAAAIDALVRGPVIQLPHTRSWAGLNVPDLWLICSAAAVAGIAAALTAPKRVLRRAILLAGLSILLVGASLLAYSRLHYLCNPAIAIVAMLVASEVQAMIERLRGRSGYRA